MSRTGPASNGRAAARRASVRAALALALAALAAAACTTGDHPRPGGVAPPVAGRASAPLRVDVPSLDRVGDAALQLPGFWFRADVPGRAPAVVLLHGCGGPYAGAPPARLSLRMREYARLLNAEGVHVLVTDSLTPRGERELCTQRAGQRAVTHAQRRRDALGALQWLAARSDVDAARLGLIGWSHGGTNVLAATQVSAEASALAAKPAFAVAFYPGCGEALRRGYRPSAPLLMLLGELDDWTPAAPCQALAARTPQIDVVTYPGAHHGFDGAPPVRLRLDVPNGVHPGQGVHVGGEPAARVAAQQQLLQFVREAVGRPTPLR